MAKAEKYLRPEVIRQVARLDLRAKFIVEGFLQGLHASPFHGFSVEFSEHRKYVPGDDLKDLDWSVLARTDKYYLKKFQAETNVTGYLAMDLSAAMAYTYRQELTKFEDAICRARADPAKPAQSAAPRPRDHPVPRARRGGGAFPLRRGCGVRRRRGESKADARRAEHAAGLSPLAGGVPRPVQGRLCAGRDRL